MGERTAYTPGTFSWADLSTSDQPAAKIFYSELFGWEATDMPVGDGVVYSMMSIGDKPVAAISPQPQAQAEAGVPPMWNSYITVESADQAANQATELGATVHAPPFDVLEAGRMAVIQDPQGAFFMVWQPNQHPGAGLVNAHGAISWNELATPDVEASSKFYADLFDWKVEPVEGMDMPYSMIKTAAGANNGGIRPVMPPGTPPHWLVYFGADEIDASRAKVAELGGHALTDVIDIGPGKFAAVQDPQGAVFALYSGQFED
jgi:predicted enzyme related to lactoylglutathione lyase